MFDGGAFGFVAPTRCVVRVIVDLARLDDNVVVVCDASFGAVSSSMMT